MPKYPKSIPKRIHCALMNRKVSTFQNHLKMESYNGMWDVSIFVPMQYIVLVLFSVVKKYQLSIYS